MIPTLYVVRHGHTDDNANTGPSNDEYLRGHRDVPLNDEGVLAAQAMARHLSKHPISHIWSSDLSRAADTATAISNTTGAPISSTRKARDWHMGIYEGELVQRVLPTLLRHCTACTATPLEGGESFQAYLDRFLPFVEEVLGKLERDQTHGVLVTHGRNTRVMKGWVEKGMEGTSIKDKYLQKKDPPVQPGELMVLMQTGGRWKVKG